MIGSRPGMARGDEVVVTGMGLVSALGTGCDVHREALRAGRDGLRPVTRFDTSGFSCQLGGCWPGWEGRKQAEPGPDFALSAAAASFPVAELAITAAREALARSGLASALERGQVSRARVGLVLGTCFGQGFEQFHGLAEQVAAALSVTGPCLTVSTACASSANALGLARDLVRGAECDAVLAGGADVLLREIFAGFAALGVLSPERCAPFSEPVGTNLAEGAGFVLLERSEGAASRGASTLSVIHGYGLSADAFHETTPDPSGAGIGRAIRGALLDAGWRGDEVDYVNAHATGTLTHDRTEWTALARELGAPERPVAVSGLKSWVGHAQGAAGVIELVLALLAAQDGTVAPTLHFRGARPGCPEDPVASPTPRVMRVERALKVSAAFGGANAVVAYGAPSAASSMRASVQHAPRAVAVRELALVSPLGVLRGGELLRLLDATHAVTGAALEPELRRIDPSINPRRLDRSSRLLTAAAALCLSERRSALRGEARERVGVFLGACRMPHESASRCKDSLRRSGGAAISASAFARMSVNAPAGACAMTLGLKGPSTTVSVGDGSGLLSIALAARWLASRGDADLIVAGALDELDPSDPGAAEGALCALLEAAGEAGASTTASQLRSSVVIAGVGLAGPGEVATAAARALGDQPELDGVIADHPSARACLGPRVPDAGRLPLSFVDVAQLWGHAPACRSALAFALAVERLRAGAGRALLVVGAASRSASVAVLVRRVERA